MSLYPTHKPLGVRKAWEHSSMGEAGAARVLHRYGTPPDWGDPIEAVAWFDDGDALRVLVADFANGRRVTLRKRKRDWQIRYTRASLPANEERKP